MLCVGTVLIFAVQVLKILFLLAGVVLAGLPLVVWFYYDQQKRSKDVIEPHTVVI